MAGFWTQANATPKRNHRFLVEITELGKGGAGSGGGAQSVIWWAKTVSTPSFGITSVTHSFLDNEYYFPGRVQWKEVSMQLVDPVSPDAVSLTNQMINDFGYVVKNRRNLDTAGQPNPVIPGSPVTFDRKRTKSAIGDFIIQILDEDGRTLEKWTLHNAFPTDIKFGDMDYSSDELRTIDMTIKFDWATCDVMGDESNPKEEYFRQARINNTFTNN
tara:strand:- start:7651 stop:8298 length:648 start_codon:yes stop_codon:yes gene_type:complete